MRIQINISGLIQGVGFRPFVYRLAEELDLKGYVLNDTAGVVIEAEGEKNNLNSFLIRVESEKPHIAKIFSLQHIYLEDKGYEEFEIRESVDQGEKMASILPDISVCDECLHEITNPRDRRFLYPFINCTNCGPRFTIVQSLPYDRKNTSMKSFQMCDDCSEEYNAPSDRRFHAQPDACHKCGPWVSLYDSNGQILCDKEEALERVTNLIRRGYIVALKGLGGFHLVCDATNEETVRRLREKKHREEKPVAVMFPSLDSITDEATVNMLERRAIESIERPIVIVNRKQSGELAESVSPDNKTIGVFLPYTPLHYLIIKKLNKPIVATSANITDEPIAKDESDAFSRLSNITEYFLVHNRDIVRRCDDSVVRIMTDRQIPIRRSRGYVPLPIIIPYTFKKPVLALGPYMNNTVGVGIGNKVYLSQHIGDLETPLATEFFEETVEDLLRLLDFEPEVVISDLHPGYFSTKYGETYYPGKLAKVQHHYAHILSCMMDNEMPEDAEVIGFAFDGTGYGPDKTIWGSEVMLASYRKFKRVAHLYPFRLPGGDKAVKEPWRTALSLLYETFADDAVTHDKSPFSAKEKKFILEMIKKNINSPVTSGMGRLFDGVASLIDLNHKVSYHAQAAIAMEQLALKSSSTDSYEFRWENSMIYHQPIIKRIVKDIRDDVPAEIIARKFHNAIIELIISIAESLRKETGISDVALSGGVFQNPVLLEGVFHKLRKKKFLPLINQRVPANDGGISLGQAAYSIFH